MRDAQRALLCLSLTSVRGSATERKPPSNKSYLASLAETLKRSATRTSLFLWRTMIPQRMFGVGLVLGRTAVLAAVICMRPLVLFQCIVLYAVMAELVGNRVSAVEIVVRTYCCAYGLLLAVQVVEWLAG